MEYVAVLIVAVLGLAALFAGLSQGWVLSVGGGFRNSHNSCWFPPVEG